MKMLLHSILKILILHLRKMKKVYNLCLINNKKRLKKEKRLKKKSNKKYMNNLNKLNIKKEET